MTVATKVKEALSSLKSAQASLEQFALQTQDKSAKQLYSNAAKQTDSIVKMVEPRVREIESQESEYKGY